MDPLVFAYYCSGHGYGHATRVSAFARHLLSLSLPRRLTVHIVSSAPRHVFADSIASGALYRYADIDPVIVQPLAYRVDRQKSVQVLQDFLANKDALLARECSWLTETAVTCVLSDAAFLGCLAAKSARIPSILITNFTFDSVYSYLTTSLVDSPAQATALSPSGSTLSPSPTDTSISSTNSDQLLLDLPIPESTLAPLVSQLHEGYQHADLLLRLPGHIPIPSFLSHPALPSSQWVDPVLNNFYSHVMNHLLSPLNVDTPLLRPRPFPDAKHSLIPRTVRAAPLLVRPPSRNIYTSAGRAEFLSKIGLPNFQGMKILIVSFGGQVFKRPGNSRTNSRIQSRFGSQETLADKPSVEKKEQLFSKHSSKDYHALGSHRSSTSIEKLALKPRDMNAPNASFEACNNLRLDLAAVDRGLRTHIKSKSASDSIKYTGRNTTKPTAPYSDENTSDYYGSGDADNSSSGDISSHPESDYEPMTATTTCFPPPISNTADEEPFVQHTINTTSISKRRHTLPRRRYNSVDLNAHARRLATPSHLHIPGAPPTSKPVNTLLRTNSLGGAKSPTTTTTKAMATISQVPEMCVIPPTPRPSAFSGAQSTTTTLVVGASMARTGLSYTTESGIIEIPNGDKISVSGSPNVGQEEVADAIAAAISETDNDEDGLLPDESWIAVICGVSKEQWNAENNESSGGENGLPAGFYVAPRDVYMPDLIAVGDVVLGKLGYGMTSECVDACTPFVYVSRPLFIEEHGLRMYLNQEGVGIELSRTSYESGEWARSVEEAHCKGLEMKEAKRKKEYEFCLEIDDGDDERMTEREEQGREMARGVVEWVDNAREIMKLHELKQNQVDARNAVVVAKGEAAVPVAAPVLPVESVEMQGIMVA